MHLRAKSSIGGEMGQKKERKKRLKNRSGRSDQKELREEALAIPDVQGVHGMNKEEC